MSGRILEFAFVTMFITVVHLTFAYFVGTVVGNEITEHFEQINNVLDNALRICYYNR